MQVFSFYFLSATRPWNETDWNQNMTYHHLKRPSILLNALHVHVCWKWETRQRLRKERTSEIWKKNLYPKEMNNAGVLQLLEKDNSIWSSLARYEESERGSFLSHVPNHFHSLHWGLRKDGKMLKSFIGKMACDGCVSTHFSQNKPF